VSYGCPRAQPSEPPGLPGVEDPRHPARRCDGRATTPRPRARARTGHPCAGGQAAVVRDCVPSRNANNSPKMASTAPMAQGASSSSASRWDRASIATLMRPGRYFTSKS
jgi:hypothetical protein